MLTTPQIRSVDVEGTALAPMGVMPIATTTHSPPGATHEKSAGAPLPKEPARQPLATATAEPRDHDTRDALENLYDNLACTD
ncbi:MAG TPA: hypothetical protein VGM06_06705 [Polyangiaceae bacterium]